MILYDEVIVETGTYDFQGAEEFPLEGFQPWGELNTKEEVLGKIEKIENDQEQKCIRVFDRITHAEKYKFEVEKKNIFLADFRTADIISEIESSSYGKEVDFFKYLYVNKEPAHWEEVKKNSMKDLADVAFAEEVVKTHGKLPAIMFLNNLNDSLVISHRLNMPVAIDAIYSPMLRQRTKAQLSSNFTVLDRLSRVGVPDFSDHSLDELLDLRKDKGLKSFRNLISTFSSSLQSNGDVNIEEKFFDEMFIVNKEFAPNKKKLALDISSGILSFAPYIVANIGTTIADVGKGLTEYRNYSKTWVSFIHNAKKLDSS